MGKGQILSLGGTWDYREMRERYRFTGEGVGGSLGSDVSERLTAVENKGAACATFQQPIGGWTQMPGLRVEHDSRRITSPGYPDVNIAGTDLFPTRHVDHRLSKALDLTLSFSKRIDRPQLNDLRPYALVQDVLTIQLGNPRLKDQSTEPYEIVYHAIDVNCPRQRQQDEINSRRVLLIDKIEWKDGWPHVGTPSDEPQKAPAT